MGRILTPQSATRWNPGRYLTAKDRLTFFIQQRLLLPALLNPINRHEAWQALKTESMSAEGHGKNTRLLKHYSDVFCLRVLVTLRSSPTRTCVTPSFRSAVRRAPANLAVSQAFFNLELGSWSVREASLKSCRSVYRSKPSNIQPGSSPRPFPCSSSSRLNSSALKLCSNLAGIELKIW